MIYYLIGLVIIIIISKKLYHSYLSKQWGCKQPFIEPGGIKYVFNLKKEHDLGYALETQFEKHQHYNRQTVGHYILGKKMIETSNSENIKALISTQFNDYGIGYRHDVFKLLLGNGIFASEGERWKISRGLLKPQFVREQISHVTMMEDHFQNFSDAIKNYHNNYFDLQDLFHKLTFDVATDFLFGESTGTLISGLHNQQFSEAFGKVQDIITYKMMLGQLHFLYSTNDFKASIRVIHDSVRYYVEKALSLSEIDLNSAKGYVFLYELVKQTRDPIVLQDELLSIMLAGRNTTSSLLSFLFYELSKNPEIFNTLRREIMDHFGNGDDLKNITFESMKRCKYLKYCINEALRMYPPVPRNLRVALHHTTIPKGGGEDESSPVFIPKGTNLLMNIYNCHRSEHFGKNVHEFDPNRWEGLKPGSNFLPFGTGPRICLGQQFALTEASYFTIRILQTFADLSGSGVDYPPKKIANTTMRLTEGLIVQMRCASDS